MANDKRHWHYEGLYDVRFMGDLKLSFGRNSRGPWLRIESRSGADLPELTKEEILPHTHKFLDLRPKSGVA